MEQKRYALHGAALWDGEDDVWRPGVTLLLARGKIVEIVPGKVCPDGFEAVTCAGQFITPGLIDMHGHFYARAGTEMRSQHRAYAPLFLAGGVTTVRTPGEFEPQETWKWKNDIRQGRAVGPRIMTADAYFDRAGSAVRWIGGCQTEAEALDQYDRQFDRMDFVKVYSNMPPDWVGALVARAHGDGLKVCGHLGATTAKEAVLAGMDGLEHGIYTMSEFYPAPAKAYTLEDMQGFSMDSDKTRELISLIVEKQVAITPTFVVHAIAAPWLDARIHENGLTAYLGEEARAQHGEKRLKIRGSVDADTFRAAEEKSVAFIERLYREGARVFAGTDPAYPMLTPGYALAWEAEYLVRCGMPAMAVMRSLTSLAAKELGIFAQTGSLAPGKAADIAVFARDPMESIGNLETIRTVFANGRMFDSCALREGARGMLA